MIDSYINGCFYSSQQRKDLNQQCDLRFSTLILSYYLVYEPIVKALKKVQ